MDRTWKWGYHQHHFISFFYNTVHMDIPGNTPTHLILIDFSSTPVALFPALIIYLLSPQPQGRDHMSPVTPGSQMLLQQHWVHTWDCINSHVFPTLTSASKDGHHHWAHIFFHQIDLYFSMHYSEINLYYTVCLYFSQQWYSELTDQPTRSCIPPIT